MLLPKQWNCENKSPLNWLWNLRNNDRCAHIVVESIFVPKCVFDQMITAKFILKTYDLETLKSRNILAHPPPNCDNFFIFVRNSNDVVDLFKTTLNRRFVPFSQVFIVVTGTGNIRFNSTVLKYIYETGVFVFLVENTYSSSNVIRYLSLQNVLTGETLILPKTNRSDVIRYFGSFKKHSFFDKNFKQKIFRVSLFKCAPYITYLPDGTFDGIQYRMLQEIAKNWKIEHKQCDFSTNEWKEVLTNVNDGVSDLAMCSIWMNQVYSGYDTGTYFDLQCGTFLVPKPKSINPAAYLYLSLNTIDWYGFVVSLITMTICFTLFTRIGTMIKAGIKDSFKDYVYSDATRSLLDTLNIVTNHGLAKFPEESTMRLLMIRFDFVKVIYVVHVNIPFFISVG